MGVRLRRAAVSALVTGAVASGLLGGLASPAVADEPADPPAQPVELAETGAGDRALIGLGVVGGVLLVGGALAIAATPRRSSDH